LVRALLVGRWWRFRVVWEANGGPRATWHEGRQSAVWRLRLAQELGAHWMGLPENARVGLQELPERPRLLRVWGRRGLGGLRGLSERWGHLRLQGGRGKPGLRDPGV
jgi:hypothetical protein